MGLGDSTELFEQHELDENNAKMEDKTFEDIAKDPQMQQQVQQYVMMADAVMNIIKEQEALGVMMPPEMVQQSMPQLPEGVPDIWDSDDDEVHVQVHNTFRKTSRYRTMPQPMRQLVDMHYQKHVDRIQAPMIAQQQAEQATLKQQADGEEKGREFEASQADKKHDQAMQTKQMDMQSKMQSEQLKSNTALQTAAMRQPTGQG